MVVNYLCVDQVTLDLHSSQEKFGSFLRTTLDVLSQLLELATLNDINKVKKKVSAVNLFLTFFFRFVNLFTWHAICLQIVFPFSVWRRYWAT